MDNEIHYPVPTTMAATYWQLNRETCVSLSLIAPKEQWDEHGERISLWLWSLGSVKNFNLDLVGIWASGGFSTELTLDWHLLAHAAIPTELLAWRDEELAVHHGGIGSILI